MEMRLSSLTRATPCAACRDNSVDTPSVSRHFRATVVYARREKANKIRRCEWCKKRHCRINTDKNSEARLAKRVRIKPGKLMRMRKCETDIKDLLSNVGLIKVRKITFEHNKGVAVPELSRSARVFCGAESDEK